jgi:hypothetical protein
MKPYGPLHRAHSGLVKPYNPLPASTSIPVDMAEVGSQKWRRIFENTTVDMSQTPSKNKYQLKAYSSQCFPGLWPFTARTGMRKRKKPTPALPT